MAINLSLLVAKPGVAPTAYQSNHTYKGYAPAVGYSNDLTRVQLLPRRPVPGPEIVERVTNALALANVTACDCQTAHNRDCIKSLNHTQAWGLLELQTVGGIVGAIGVGHGKTILGILAPLVTDGCQTAIMLCPPGLVEQVIREYQLIRNHFRVPSIVVHGRNSWEDFSPGRPTLHVVPYSLLSSPKATALFSQFQPDLVIADEAHRLRHPQTATTSRLLRYFEEHPSAKFVAWTGSLTDSSIRDYAHLCAIALKDGSPLPLNRETVNEWAGALDPSDKPAAPGALLDLCEPGEHYKKGYQRRLIDTPGFIVTEGQAIESVGLQILERPAPTIPAEVVRHLRGLRETWTRPDGEELVDALAVSRCALELAAGFYYRWKFPRGEPVELIEEWLLVRQDWNRELRDKLKTRVEHLDSPLLCTNAAARYRGEMLNPKNLPVWASKVWPKWARIRDAVQPETEAVRVDDYLVQDAATWARENVGIVWYDKAEFGHWLSEVSGLPFYGGGPKALAALRKERGDRSVILSIDSHGTGRDGLQYLFRKQLIANPPSSPTGWEQLLGRLHRPGQRNHVDGYYYSHTPELKEALQRALAKVNYVTETLSARQKLTGALVRNPGNRGEE